LTAVGIRSLLRLKQKFACQLKLGGSARRGRDSVLTGIAVLVLVGLVSLVLALAPLVVLLFAGEFVLQWAPLGTAGRYSLIIFKNLRRNTLRTGLTYLATFVLVVVVTLVWSALYYLDQLTTEKSQDIKLIVSEKWQANGGMPIAYAQPLSQGAADLSRSGETRPQDHMTWQIYLGTMDREKNTRENQVFLIALDPAKIPTFLESFLRDIDPGRAHAEGSAVYAQQSQEMSRAVELMQKNKKAVIVGRTRLQEMNKRVGERFTLTGVTYAGIDLEFEIVGTFPPGRFDQNAVMNRDYLNDSLDAYARAHGGRNHPMASRTLNLVWLQVHDLEEFSQISRQIEHSPLLQSPPLKSETLSSGITTALEGFRDLIWGMRWLLSPAILATMTLVLANAISISVRERRTELAVLKVLGFRPLQILMLVLGEAALIGGAGGLISVILTYFLVNDLLNTFVPNPIFVPPIMLAWGAFLGAGAAILGSLAPAWTACRIRVSEVFARIG
jgi:putative ABC transport system permease protein